MSNVQFKKGIQKAIIDCRAEAQRYRKLLKTIKVSHPKYKALQTTAEYFDNSCRYHQTTLLLVLAHEKNTPAEKLVEMRKTTMLEHLEQMQFLVQEGIFKESDYLERCNEYKRDFTLLQSY
jgi:hypothetical protein